MALSIKQLEAFVAVVEMGTFRRAAERLNTTQPNISARIANLEQRLSGRLMERDAGAVRLTPLGETVLPHARAVLAAAAALIGAAKDDALFEGSLRLGVSEMVAHTWLRDFLVAMKARFPNVLVELTVDLSANLSEALQKRDLDLAFQNGPFERSTSGRLPLSRHPNIWVAAPGLGVRDEGRTAGDILPFPILTHARQTTPYRQLAGHFGRGAGPRARLVPASNAAACLQMCLDGLGIACLPKPMVDDAVASGKLVQLRYPWTPDDLSFEARFDAATAPPYVAEAAAIAQGLAQRIG